MHLVNCFVALNGDLNNVGHSAAITLAELEVLRLIHGQNSISGVKLVGASSVTGEEEYQRLLGKYPRYQEKVRGYWRDAGAKFPTDIREIRLSESELARPVAEQVAAQEKVRAAPMTKARKAAMVDEAIDQAV